MKNILIVLFLLSLSSNAFAEEEWRGYVVKKSEYSKYSGDDLIPFMVFLDEKNYSSKSICYNKMSKKATFTKSSKYMFKNSVPTPPLKSVSSK